MAFQVEAKSSGRFAMGDVGVLAFFFRKAGDADGNVPARGFNDRMTRLFSFADVPGGAYGEDALIALHEEHPFQHAATLIVEEVFEPAVFD